MSLVYKVDLKCPIKVTQTTSNWSEEENRRAFGRWALRPDIKLPHSLSVHYQKYWSCFKETDLVDKLRLEISFGEEPQTWEAATRQLYCQCTEILKDKAKVESVTISPEKEFKVVDFGSENEQILIFSTTVNCVHRHHNPDLDPEQNKKLYGQCSRLHGHEYQVEVLVGGHLQPSGLSLQRAEVELVIEENIRKPFHGAYLNEIVGNTSGEIIVERIAEKLKEKLGSYRGLRLRETRKNSFFDGDFFSLEMA